MLIAVEGIDGAGKTTIAKHLCDFLSKRGHSCVVFKEPSDSIYGRIIKSLKSRLSPERELELFLLDREIDVRERINPALEEGKIVIMDRYYYSNIAYQSACGLKEEMIKELNERIAPKPDLVILLDISPSKALERIKNRENLSVFERREYLEKVREKFLKIADERTVIIDAEKELEIVKREVEKVVMKHIEEKYKRSESDS
uniref:Probable thymidylate kinase n=1 Tax=Archaeoglobus fulgidus TaxID=2234 RepID=A0A7J2TJQ0_ARCFL